MFAFCMTCNVFTNAQSRKDGEVTITSRANFNELPDTIKTQIQEIYKYENKKYTGEALQVFTGMLIVDIMDSTTHVYKSWNVGLVCLVGIPKPDPVEGMNDVVVWISLNNKFKIQNNIDGYVKSNTKIDDFNYLYGVVDFEPRIVTLTQDDTFLLPENQSYRPMLPQIVQIKVQP